MTEMIQQSAMTIGRDVESSRYLALLANFSNDPICPDLALVVVREKIKLTN